MLIANYATSAWRNILRHKLFSTINILGLSIGLAAVMLIALYVRYETSYDNFWKNADNIYRLHITFNVPGQAPVDRVATPGPIVEAMTASFPEIEEFARTIGGTRTVTFDQNNYSDRVYYVDQQIVNIFDFEAVSGNIETALNDISGLVLTESRARKYFGQEDPIGKNVTIEGDRFGRDYRVAAVIRDLPSSSKLNIEAMVPINRSDWGNPSILDDWFSAQFHSYFKVKPGTDIDQIVEKIPTFTDNSFPVLPIPDTKPTDIIDLSIMNIKDLHLNAVGGGEYTVSGNRNTVITFTAVAILILMIASINFMNLSTARAGQRAREVALRKVMGAERKNLVFQFIGESIILTILGLLFAIVIVEMFLPIYASIIEKPLAIDYGAGHFASILFITILVGAVGGIYPAFVLSNAKPAKTLKSNRSTETKETNRFRFSLVLLQFIIAIVLFVSTAAIYSQIKFVANMDLGYDRENLVTISGSSPEKLSEKIDIIKQRFSGIPGVTDVTWAANVTPGSASETVNGVRAEKNVGIDPSFVRRRDVGLDFLKTYDVTLLAGRDFDRNRTDERASNDAIAAGNAHTAGLILNQTAVREFGLGSPDEALGEILYAGVAPSDTAPNGVIEAEYEVIGVIDDIHLRDLKETIVSEFYVLTSSNARYVTLRYDDNPVEIIEQARKIWQEELPELSFNYEYASDALADQYAAEQGQMTMFTAFSGLAIFIACLGLFGLASFTAERRTKEIGIRKVFGAEVWQIVRMLVFQFSKPVLIANIIAWPVAYLAMSRWLESFVYRIDDMMIIALCLVAGLSALLIAWATVAGNSYAVARQNPIKALRYE